MEMSFQHFIKGDNLMSEAVYKGNIETLNSLHYYIGTDNASWVEEQNLIHSICNNNGAFYMKYFMGGTYLNLKNKNGMFPLLHVLIAIHEVYEIISDLSDKTEEESEYLRKIYPFIFQLAKIGASELEGKRVPIQVMEEMLMQRKA